MKRRQLLGALSAGLLASACSNPGARTLSKALEDRFNPTPSFDPGYPDKLPYASLSARIGEGKAALLILGKVEGNHLEWISADREVLVTRHGRIVKTVGLTENLLASTAIDKDFLEAPSHQWAANPDKEYRRLLDFSPGNHYAAPCISKLRTGPTESLTIGVRQYTVRRIDEHCTIPSMDWAFINSYWVDEQGFAWKSIQHIGPRKTRVVTEITKKYG